MTTKELTITIDENTIVKEPLHFQIADTDGKVLMIVKDSRLEFPNAKGVKTNIEKIKTVNDKGELEECGHVIMFKVYTRVLK